MSNKSAEMCVAELTYRHEKLRMSDVISYKMEMIKHVPSVQADIRECLYLVQ